MAYLNDSSNFMNSPRATAAKAIYLLAIDDSIDEETLAKFKQYCEAFYHGVVVKVALPGTKIEDRTVAENFIEAHSIATRRQSGLHFQLNAEDINDVLAAEYKAEDAFYLLAITNQDLYLHAQPNDSESSYVFGLANTEEGCGTFSFYRHQGLLGQNCEPGS